MADIFSKTTRSKIMASIRSSHTDPEKMVAKILNGLKIKHSRHTKSVPGSPDFVLRKHKLVIFVHGCFWHVHGCHVSRLPEDRRDFWTKKFRRNIKRDLRTYRLLKKQGWRVIVIWECALKGKKKMNGIQIAEKILSLVNEEFSFKQIKGRIRPDISLKKKILI